MVQAQPRHISLIDIVFLDQNGNPTVNSWKKTVQEPTTNSTYKVLPLKFEPRPPIQIVSPSLNFLEYPV